MRLFVSTITATVVTLASSTVSAFVVAVSRPSSSSSSPLSPTIITTSSSTTSTSQLKMSQEVQQPDVSSYMSGARPVSYHAKSKSSVI